MAITLSRYSDFDAFEDAKSVAVELANRLDWLEDDQYLQGAELPNGDYCFLPLRFTP